MHLEWQILPAVPRRRAVLSTLGSVSPPVSQDPPCPTPPSFLELQFFYFCSLVLRNKDFTIKIVKRYVLFRLGRIGDISTNYAYLVSDGFQI